MKLRVFNMMARMLLLTFCMTAFTAQSSDAVEQSNDSSILSSSDLLDETGSLVSSQTFKMTAKKSHQLIGEQQPFLLGDGTQLVSLYYFGQNDATSVVGLERVGDDYLPIRWLLVFEGQTLLGWYYPIGEFPVRFKDGHLAFPRGASSEDIFLFPHPPSLIEIEGIEIPFVTPGSTLFLKDDSSHTSDAAEELEQSSSPMDPITESLALQPVDTSIASNHASAH